MPEQHFEQAINKLIAPNAVGNCHNFLGLLLILVEKQDIAQGILSF